MLLANRKQIKIYSSWLWLKSKRKSNKIGLQHKYLQQKGVKSSQANAISCEWFFLLSSGKLVGAQRSGAVPLVGIGGNRLS